MENNSYSKIPYEAGNHAHEIIIKINLEDVFHNRQCHPEAPDEGTVVYYIYRVDKTQFEEKDYIKTGAELLAKVGLSPDKYRLFQLGHELKEILPDDVVDLRKPGIERFKSVPKHANEGFQAGSTETPICRKAVHLPLEDELYLNRFHTGWETIMEGNQGWIIIPNFKIPTGYNTGMSAVAFMIPPSYPTIEFDMMYFYPAISRNDGLSINCLSDQPLDGKNYQRWSRHRNPGEWRPGIDNVETHVVSVLAWLIDEFKKR